jgi:hypothetical protein
MMKAEAPEDIRPERPFKIVPVITEMEISAADPEVL